MKNNRRMPIIFENGIELPNGRCRQTGKMALLRKALLEMKAGQSFKWEGNKLPYRVAEQMKVRIATRKLEDGTGYRVWRRE